MDPEKLKVLPKPKRKRRWVEGEGVAERLLLSWNEPGRVFGF